MRVTANISIDESLIEERFIRAGGPGGQNVNKVSTAVELRFDSKMCRDLTATTRARLATLAGSRMTDEGVIIIRAERFRNQALNRTDARNRLVELLRRAAVAPRKRIATRPSRAVKERRLKAKAHRSTVKNLRRSKPDANH